MTTPTSPFARETLLNQDGYVKWPFQKIFAVWNTTLSHITSTFQNVLTIQPSGMNITVGTGNPNGAVLGIAGDLFINRGGGAGTTLWVKESGTNTNTGWVGK